ncbi:glycosyltransferase family 4 protein [Spirosoma sp. KNUC1025]|uniref:glycosyltransferase family 4 protein n=1 Tax=Spirosoma sp. KNUC1025 TaxID=2894082 RepID=UPI00386FF2D9|nr:glycosyltransferase family 4 protein [Spirosoma sp. KNUC1025]
MKIVHCLFTMRTGGAQLLTIDLLNELCMTHDVSLIVVNDHYSESMLEKLNKNVAVYCLNRREGSRNPLPMLRLNLLLNRIRPDVIHCHERKMIRLIKYRGAHTVYTVHDVNIPTDTFHQYQTLVAISDAVANDIQTRSAFSAVVVPNGIPIHQFKCRSQYTLRHNEPIRLVQISRLIHEKKGQDILILALAKLIHEQGMHQLQLDFVGDGESLDHLKSLTKLLGVEPYVRFQGEKDRNWIKERLASYHILVQPSRYEGFGLTVVEGLAAGLPVAATDIEGPAEILRGLPGNILFSRNSVEACAEALQRLIATYDNDHLASDLRIAKKGITQRFSIQAMTKAYEAVYQNHHESVSLV